MRAFEHPEPHNELRLSRRDLVSAGAVALTSALALGEAPPVEAAVASTPEYVAVGYLAPATPRATKTRIQSALNIRSASQRFGGAVTVDFHGVSGTVLQPVTLTARFPMENLRLRRYHPYYVTSIGLDAARASQPSRFRMPLDLQGGVSFVAIIGTGDEQVTTAFRVSTERGSAQLNEGTYFVLIGNPQAISRLNWQNYRVGPAGPEAGLVRAAMVKGALQTIPVEFMQFTFSISPVDA
jgi:hypothetical protein